MERGEKKGKTKETRGCSDLASADPQMLRLSDAVTRFPHPDTLDVDGLAVPAAEVLRVLDPFLTDERRTRIAAAVAARCYGVVPVLEGVHDAGNLAAVMRSAEGLGFGQLWTVALAGDADVLAQHGAERLRKEIDQRQQGRRRPARRQSQGADKWLDVRAFASPAAFAEAARAAGYRIACTHLSADAVPIAELDFTQPTALVLGNEKDGISDALLAEADQNVVLPIDGFIQSYNVSVAAALALYHARHDRVVRQGRHGDLSEAEQAILSARFAHRSVSAADAILKRALREGDLPAPPRGQ